MTDIGLELCQACVYKDEDMIEVRGCVEDHGDCSYVCWEYNIGTINQHNNVIALPVCGRAKSLL